MLIGLLFLKNTCIFPSLSPTYVSILSLDICWKTHGAHSIIFTAKIHENGKDTQLCHKGRRHRGVWRSPCPGSLCFSLPQEIHRMYFSSLGWKCSNMCAVFMPREMHQTAPGFYCGHGYPLSSIHSGSRLSEGKWEFGISHIVCTNSRYNDLLSSVNRWPGPLCQPIF